MSFFFAIFLVFYFLKQQYLVFFQTHGLSSLGFLATRAVSGLGSISWTGPFSPCGYSHSVHSIVAQVYYASRLPLQITGFVAGLCYSFCIGSMLSIMKTCLFSMFRGEGSSQAGTAWLVFTEICKCYFQQQAFPSVCRKHPISLAIPWVVGGFP